MSQRRRFAFRALVACMLFGATAATADWKDSHKSGVAALEGQRWAEAEKLFRAAIEERREERVNRLLKIAYLPHYHLGVALAEQGDCRAALSSFAESQSQGQIQKSKLADDLTKRRDDCRNHLRTVDAAVAEIESILSKADAASQALSGLAKTSELAPQWAEGDASFAARQQQAKSSLDRARQELEQGAGSTDLRQLADAKTSAETVLSSLQTTLRAARARLAELNAEIASALEDLQEATEGAQRTLRSIRGLQPYPAKLGARVARVESALEASEGSDSSAGPESLRQLTTDLEAAHRRLRQTARRPPKKLRDAAQALFSGDRNRARELLADERLANDKRATPYLCLFRSAVHYGEWAATGEGDPELYELAAQALTSCEEQPPAAPVGQFFSPRFVEFHNATLAALAAEQELIEAATLEGLAEPAAEDETAAESDR